MFFIIISIAGLSLIAAEQCSFHPGEVQFTYKTTTDYNSYFKNYRKGYTKRYTVRRYMQGDVFVQQVRQQHFLPQIQQQQSLNFLNTNNNNNLNRNSLPTPDPPAPNKTEEKPDEPLPIWKVRLPQNAKSARFIWVENGEGLEEFNLTAEDFENSTRLASYIREIDVTEKNITPDAWYLVCMNFSVVEMNKLNTCEHCSLIKACTERYSCKNKFMDAEVVRDQMSDTEVAVQYHVADLQMKSASVTSNLIYEPTVQRRCLSREHIENPVMGWLFADTITLIEHKNLSKNRGYILRADIRGIIEISGTDEEFLLGNYLKASGIKVRRCDSVPEYKYAEARG